MAFETKPNTGTLFNNTQKKSDTHPDYKGTIKVGNKEYELAGWKKTSAACKTYMSLKVSEPYNGGNKQPSRSAGPAVPDESDDIPFAPNVL